MLLKQVKFHEFCKIINNIALSHTNALQEEKYYSFFIQSPQYMNVQII